MGATPVGSVNPRDISYASSARTPLGRAAVRVIENATGRLPLLLRLRGFQEECADGAAIWDVIFRRYDLRLSVLGAGLAGVPERGPVLILCNHPFGILDGLALGQLLHRRGRPFKIVANALFAQAPELAPYILPIDFTPTRAAQRANLRTRQDCVATLRREGVVALFPAGAVSAGARWSDRPFDAEWRPFAARLIRDTEAAIVPVFFEGRNSRLFQILGAAAPALRYGLHMREFARVIGTTARAHVGAPIDRTQIAPLMNRPGALMSELRRRTYALSPEPLGDPPIGRRWV